MAVMIPSRPAEDTKSAAERKLFDMFKKMPDTDDWKIIHSVSLANHPTQSQGEADFLAVIPNKGVFALEVKGGVISYDAGTWFSKDRYDTCFNIKDPVNEANQAMHGISDFLKRESGITDLNKCLFGFGVIFPDSDFHGRFAIPDVDDIQIADISDYDDLKSYFLRLAAFWRKKLPFSLPPTHEQCKEIVNLLRPQFTAAPSLSTIIKSIEGQSITLTDNQKNVFEGLEDNERCLVRGSAGTGKTVIAIQYAKKLADSGKSTAVFCYNTRLANYLKSNVPCGSNLICDSFTEHMESVCLHNVPDRLEKIKEGSLKDYYATLLPELFTEIYLDLELPQVDYLIVDEAQDLMTPNFLDAFEVMLKGGLTDGNWCFFMDAEKQNLFHSKTTYEEILALLKQRHAFFAKYALTDNCRNSAAIIKKVDSIFGTRTSSLRKDEIESEVRIKKYKRNSDEAEMIEGVILAALKDGVKPEQITILSPNRLANSAVVMISNPAFSISDKQEKDSIMFCTIDGYKGLENSVIILTDIYELDADKNMNRLYVGMTRAKSLLYVFASDKALRLMN